MKKNLAVVLKTEKDLKIFEPVAQRSLKNFNCL